LGSIKKKNVGKAPKILFFKIMKNIKIDIMGVKNISILVGENEISYFKIMKVKIISLIFYMTMDYQFLVTNYLVNNLFK
jgi:hypothetical protein